MADHLIIQKETVVIYLWLLAGLAGSALLRDDMRKWPFNPGWRDDKEPYWCVSPVSYLFYILIYPWAGVLGLLIGFLLMCLRELDDVKPSKMWLFRPICKKKDN